MADVVQEVAELESRAAAHKEALAEAKKDAEVHVDLPILQHITDLYMSVKKQSPVVMLKSFLNACDQNRFALGCHELV